MPRGAGVHREQQLVRFFLNPANYPHRVDSVVHRETHISHVFLAGPFAYKLKKSVAFPFLDASTLAKRKRWCRLEVALNRRLAPQLYLGVVPVVETPQGLRLSETGKVVEWVVKMYRLPEERMLDQLVATSQAGRRDMKHVGDQLIKFFKRAKRSQAIDRYGQPTEVAALVLGNLQECQPFVRKIFQEDDRRFIASAYRQFLALSEPLLARRVREGRIRDGHGDLRCENICMTNPVTIFDCVEFQPAFRCGDLANDFGFLLMDLEFRGRGDLADALVAQYRQALNDPMLDIVLSFYKCHRSLVRGKVRGLAWLQHPRTPTGRRLRALAARHFHLARRYAGEFSKPRLVVVGGLIGTGKSTLAQQLANTLGATWLRTDEIRVREFGSMRTAHQQFGAGLYAPRVSARVYQRLIQRAEALVRRGESVVCDGMFSKATAREVLRAVAERHDASFHFFECVVPRAAALRRVRRRLLSRTDLSEARPDYYDSLKAGFEPVRGWPASAWTRLKTTSSPSQVHDDAVTVLRHAWCRSNAFR